jgi:hypothetical protein
MRSFMILLAVATFAGCGDGYPARVPVSGSVTFQGKPLAGANITFLSTASDGKSASGKTDDNGNYQLSSYATHDGAIPGDYIVTVAVLDMTTANLDVATAEDLGADYTAMMNAAASNRPKTQPGGVPAKYADASQTDLKQSVSAGGPNVIDLKLE